MNRYSQMLAVAVALAAPSACSSSDGATGGAGGSSGAAPGDSGAESGGRGGTAALDSGRHDGALGDSAASDGAASDSAASNSAASDAAGGSFGDPSGTTAVPASTFLDSIGVCAHVAQGVDAPAESATAMFYAGIRNLRDDGRPATVPGWISMHESAGIRVCVLTDQVVSSTLDMAKQLNEKGALLAIEGANEPNNFPVTYDNQKSDFATTFVPVANLQRDLYAAVKAEPALAGIPVFHTSEAGGSEPDDVGLQFLTIPAGAGTSMPEGTKYADYANVHNYICGHNSRLVDNLAWNASDPTLDDDWDGLYVEYGHTWHGGFTGYSKADLATLPRVTTETGWVTSGSGAITQEQQARIFLNLYLSAFKQGFSYTFIYMLRDDPNQGYWGLFDTSYQPKTSGTYLHNLTTILADTGSRSPDKLSYSIAAEPATVHDLLLQKSDGTFALVVWDERPSGGSDDVTVDLDHARATVTVYDPTAGTAPTQTLHDASRVTLTLSDHPAVIAL
jgi:hypothetical protein